jgi:hypothetical protein
MDRAYSVSTINMLVRILSDQLIPLRRILLQKPAGDQTFQDVPSIS